MIKIAIALVTFMAASVLIGTAEVNATEEQEGVLLREVAVADSDYCPNLQLEFEPGDVVDYYGPCSFNPLAKDEIQKQIAASYFWAREGENESGD